MNVHGGDRFTALSLHSEETRIISSNLESALDRLQSSEHPHITAAVQRIRAAGATTEPALLTLLTGADHELAQTACWIFGQLRRRRPALQLVQVLAGDYPHLWTALGSALADINSPRTVAPLIAILQQGGHPNQREAAAYALGWLNLTDARAQAAGTALVATLNNPAEDPLVRAQAAESLAYRYGNLTCTNPHDRPDATAALAALRSALRDTGPVLRFWAAFALGQMHDVEALPALHALAADPTVVPGWWTVGEEATDAITTIGGGQPPDRISHAVPPEVAP